MLGLRRNEKLDVVSLPQFGLGKLTGKSSRGFARVVTLENFETPAIFLQLIEAERKLCSKPVGFPMNEDLKKIGVYNNSANVLVDGASVV